MENHGCGSHGDLNFCLDSAKTGLSDPLTSEKNGTLRKDKSLVRWGITRTWSLMAWFLSSPKTHQSHRLKNVVPGEFSKRFCPSFLLKQKEMYLLALHFGNFHDSSLLLDLSPPKTRLPAFLSVGSLWKEYKYLRNLSTEACYCLCGFPSLSWLWK